jgi:polysaccharide biosynthesis protein PslJ
MAAVALGLAAFAALMAGVLAGSPRNGFASAVLLAVAGGLAFAPRLSWRWLLAALVLVILFIPIRRYSMSAALPFQLEPYRILVALLVGGWLLSLHADPRVRLRPSGLERPLLLVLAATVLSLAANGQRVAALDLQVVKSLTFFGSFLLVLYLVVSVVRSIAAVELVVKMLVAGGAVLALLAIVETGTGYAPFNSLGSILPFMHLNPEFEPALVRGARLRAFGPAEHPIALGALLVILIPLAVYLTFRVHRRWLWALGLLTLGTLATLSRTGVLMLVVVAVVFLVLRPRQTKRLWPLVVPLIVATHFVMPGTLGTIKQSFFPAGGLIQEQRSSAGSLSSAGRIDDLGASLEEFAVRPLFGYGYGTRIVTGPDANARILDNQWLATLLETGLVGLLGWVWLFGQFVLRSGRRARTDNGRSGWLLAAITASVTAYVVGMLTFDAFSFIQVTFILFLLLGLGAVLLQSTRTGRAS